MSQNLECGSSMSLYHYISEQKLCNDGWAKFFLNLILYLNAKVDNFYIFDCAVVMSFLDENQNLDFIINY